MSIINRARRFWYRHTQTGIEKDLEQRTIESIKHLAEVLEIDETDYSQNLPMVRYKPKAKTSAYHIDSNTILLKDDEKSTIYEETGHFLHYQIKEEDKNFDFLTAYTQSILNEAVGYFCQHLSGDKPEGPTLESERKRIKKDKKFMKNKQHKFEKLKPRIDLEDKTTLDYLDAVDKLAKDIEHRQVLLSIGDQTHKTLEDYLTLKQNKATAQIPEEVLYQFYLNGLARTVQNKPGLVHKGLFLNEEFTKKDFKRLNNATRLMFIYEDFAELYFNIVQLMIQNKDDYQRLYHEIGYQLGEKLYQLYEQDKTRAVRMIKQIMQTPADQSLDTFAEIYTALNEKKNKENIKTATFASSTQDTTYYNINENDYSRINKKIDNTKKPINV